MSETPTMRLWLWFTGRYRCRCEPQRLSHEQMHDAIREFMRPPSASEMQAAREAIR